MQLVNTPHLNVGGTLSGEQGPCIDTGKEAPISGATSRVYIGRPDALEIARLAREAGWLTDELTTVRRRNVELEEQAATMRAQLQRVHDYVAVEAAV